MKYHCCDQRRLDVLELAGSANAIEFLEVLDRSAPLGVAPQQTLFVRLLHPTTAIKPGNLVIGGGERIRTVGVKWVAPADALPPEAEPGLTTGLDELPRTLVIRTDSSGDFSRYTLRIVASPISHTPLAGFDPRLASIEFSFKVECPSPFDCDAPLPCPPAPLQAPPIDYLAKDYQGFRRLMLDRLSLLAPTANERSAADVAVMLVELLAFAADTLSYKQDAVANEAYLATARRRVSVRRHARLVDYYLHEGCNARAFVRFKVKREAGPQVLPARSRLLTRGPFDDAVIPAGGDAERQAHDAGALVFETVHAATLRYKLNRLRFYTWGDDGCCLPRGATGATLRGHAYGLHTGDFLIFKEVKSPTTFVAADADRTHVHAVRLTKVTHTTDPSGRLFDEPPVDAALDVTAIEWDSTDALPFPLCVSVVSKPDVEISVAFGNIVLVEHGETLAETTPLEPMPPPVLPYAKTAHVVGECCGTVDEPEQPPLRYRPTLARAPLAHGFALADLLGVALDDRESWWSAAALRGLRARDAMPQLVELRAESGPLWTVQRDLLASGPNSLDVVVEIEDDGRARLRFGDDQRGRRPDEGTKFFATYRVGNGTLGNVGADAIAHLVGAPLAIDSIGNPLPAFGGAEPEDVEAARRDAPYAFRRQERAVTAEDYAAKAELRRDVQRAAARFRWTGSWHTVFVSADRFGGAAIDPDFETGLRRHLERFRMAGYDLEVDGPSYVALDLALHVCVKAGYFRSDVLRAVGEALGSSLLPDGRRGAFHPDNFSFGEHVYLSRVVAAAQAVEGVESVRTDRFQRLLDPSPASKEDGVIRVGRFEIAQLENNPNFRERGLLRLTAGGGK